MRFFAFFELCRFFVGDLRLQYNNLAKVWIDVKCKEEKNDAVFTFVIGQVGNINILNEEESSLKERVRTFCKNLAERWNKSHRKIEVFQKQNAHWLRIDFILATKITPSKCLVGRPKIKFVDKSERAKNREAKDLSKKVDNETELLVRAASIAARVQRKADMAVVLRQTIASPTRACKMRKLAHTVDNQPIRFTANKALAFLLENNLTKEQYLNTRKGNKIRNADIYPLYNEVANSKKSCRPVGIEVNERQANVSLQSLLTHTANRIVAMQKEVIVSLMTENINFLKADLIVSYGFDGSTGHSSYKQKFQEASTSDDSDYSLFATTMTPLRLVDSVGRPLWNNRTPQSIRFCRPIKLEFCKETKEKILLEDNDLKQQINGLNSLKIVIDVGKIIEIHFKLFLTLIDGKVLNVLTNTKSSQSCPICKATPKDFMTITDFKSQKFLAQNDTLKYGISPLHCWIRFFEFVLHAGYKSSIKKWQIRTDDDRKTLSEKKACTTIILVENEP